ncbi:MAG: type II toxin-antitoxin system VapC family toxin [Ottowia sp.]|nr:type II toxin-antitoxin system VapC family toxin [Ottowia sp.]MBQ9578955.1 type II toxin-antitoxin system VapC family toxin [Ottowia sp.]
MLVDANIFIDVFGNDPVWKDWSLSQLKAQSFKQDLVINHIIYAEISLSFTASEQLDAFLEEARIVVLGIPKDAAFLAGKAFAQYRKNGGTKTNVLSDFFIGAHAQVAGMPILTRDVQRYRAYFPDVPLVTPTMQ